MNDGGHSDDYQMLADDIGCQMLTNDLDIAGKYVTVVT